VQLGGAGELLAVVVAPDLTEQPHYLYTLTRAGEQRRKFLGRAENDANHAESHYDLA
jgi:hypothetical protein